MCPVTAAPVVTGSRFRTIQSQINPIPFIAGNTASVELPRSFLYKMLRCRLRGSITTVAATATPIGENPLGLIKRMDIIADGRKQLISAAGQDLYRMSNLFNGKAGEIVPGPVGATTNVFDAFFDIHHEAARMRTPIMSYFDPRPYEKVEARVQWGTPADIYSVPGVTPTFGADCALDIQAVQSAEGAEQIGFNRLVSFDEFTFAGAFNNFTVNVPRSGLLAGILLRTQIASGGGFTPSNTIFQNAAVGSANIFGTLSLKSDNNFLHIDNLNATTLQAANVPDYLLDQNNGAAAPITGQGITGYYFLDLTEDGLLSSLLNTFDLNVLQMVLSSQSGLATASVVRVTYVFYEPIIAA